MPSQSPCFTIRFAGSQDGVRQALAFIVARLSRAGADADFCGRAEIVLAEVLNNIVEHALRGKACVQIEARGTRLDSGWQFIVQDPGHPMPGGAPPIGAMPGLDTGLDDLPEGGFGWAMVRLLAQQIEYSRWPQRNRLGFLIPHTSA